MPNNVPRRFIRRKIVAPCYGCEVRAVGCHSKCEAYNNYKSDIQKDTELRDKFYEQERKFDNYIIKSNVNRKKAQERR